MADGGLGALADGGIIWGLKTLGVWRLLGFGAYKTPYPSCLIRDDTDQDEEPYRHPYIGPVGGWRVAS